MTRRENLFWNALAALIFLSVGFLYFGSDTGQPSSAAASLMQDEAPPRSVPGLGVTSSRNPIRSAYVPAYSNVRVNSGRAWIDLATTLSVHNTSRDRHLVVERISYFDTDGRVVEDYLSEAVTLLPLATTQVFVAAEDRRGGAGANFVVDWRKEPGTSDPVIEAVMVGLSGTTSYSLVTRAHAIEAAAAR